MSDAENDLLPGTRRALLHRVATAQSEGRAPSVAGAVIRDGGQAWFGARSMLAGHEPDANTQYRIGSLTKTFVAVLIMRLRAEGRLDLAAPAAEYLGGLEPAAGPATIAQLLSHSAGLAAETRGPWWERTPGSERPSLGDIFGDDPRPLPAGRQFHYSNPGFALLGAIAARLRGHDWDEAVRREILEPLGMSRTTLRAQAPHAGGFAVHPWADVMQPEPAEYTGHMAPAGDLWSTSGDLCRYAAFLLDGDDRVLPAPVLEQMRAPASPPAGTDGGYGLGIQSAERAGRTLYGHTGSMPGFLAALWVSPDDRIGAVTLANTTAGPPIAEIAADLIGIVADAEPRFPDRWTPRPGIGPELLALTGLWYWGPRATVLRLLSPDMLELIPASGPGRGSRFRAAGEGTWTGLDGYYAGETLRLVPAADGVAAHLDLGTFIFTREPYGPDSPVAARPHEDGWQAGNKTPQNPHDLGMLG